MDNRTGKYPTAVLRSQFKLEGPGFNQYMAIMYMCVMQCDFSMHNISSLYYPYLFNMFLDDRGYICIWVTTERNGQG